MEGYLRWRTNFLFVRVWVVIDGQELNYYEYFDQTEQMPKKIKGNLPLKEAQIFKLINEKNPNEFGLKIKTNKGKATFLCSDSTTWNTWFNVFNRAIKLHQEIEERQQRPHLTRNILGIPEEKYGKLTKAMITRAYKRLCLKEHPDKGGNPEKFHQIHEAYKLLLSIEQDQTIEENSMKIRYEVTIQKVSGVGLGLAVTEDKTKGRIFVSGINPNTKIIGITEEANGEIKMNDILIGIDKDDCSQWFLSRVRARLDNFRCPVGNTVTFTFERLVPLDSEDHSGGEDDTSDVSMGSPSRNNTPLQKDRSYYNTSTESATWRTSTSAAEVPASVVPIIPEPVANKPIPAATPIFAMPPPPEEPAPAAKPLVPPAPIYILPQTHEDEPPLKSRSSSVLIPLLRSEEKREEKDDHSIHKSFADIDYVEDDDISEESYHYGKGRRTPSPSSFRLESPKNSVEDKTLKRKESDKGRKDSSPILLTPPESAADKPTNAASKGIESSSLDSSYFIHSGPTIIINQAEDADQFRQFTQKELRYRNKWEGKKYEQMSNEEKIAYDYEKKVALLQLELERFQQKEIRIRESNEHLNNFITNLLSQREESLQQRIDQEKMLYEKELALRQLSAEQLAMKQLLHQQLPHHINNQNKSYLFHQYQLLQQQYYQYVYYDRSDYERKLQQYRDLLYGNSSAEDENQKLDFSQSNPLFHSNVLENMAKTYTEREKNAIQIEQSLKSLLFSE